MKGKLFLNIKLVFLCLFVLEVTTQYNGALVDGMSQDFQYYPFKNFADSLKLYQQQFYSNPEEYNDYADGNICSCENCNDLKPECRNMCPNCAQVPSLSQPYYYIQYPFPYPITPESPKPQEEVETTSTVLTTTTKVTTPSETTIEDTTKISTEATIENTTQMSTKTNPELTNKTETIAYFSILESKATTISNSLDINDKNPYIITSIRRTKPNWIPKYGVLPMSDRFAEKLMLKLRSMKVLHPRKDNFRDVDDIKTVN